MPAVTGHIGKEDPRPTHPEEGVGNQHGALIARVPVEGDVFCGDYQGPAVGLPC